MFNTGSLTSNTNNNFIIVIDEEAQEGESEEEYTARIQQCHKKYPFFIPDSILSFYDINLNTPYSSSSSASASTNNDNNNNIGGDEGEEGEEEEDIMAIEGTSQLT